MFKPCYSFFRLLLRHPNKCPSPQLHARSMSAPGMGGNSCTLLIVHFPSKEGYSTTHEKQIVQALSTPVHAATWQQSSYTVLKTTGVQLEPTCSSPRPSTPTLSYLFQSISPLARTQKMLTAMLPYSSLLTRVNANTNTTNERFC